MDLRSGYLEREARGGLKATVATQIPHSGLSHSFPRLSGNYL